MVTIICNSAEQMLRKTLHSGADYQYKRKFWRDSYWIWEYQLTTPLYSSRSVAICGRELKFRLLTTIKVKSQIFMTSLLFFLLAKLQFTPPG